MNSSNLIEAYILRPAAPEDLVIVEIAVGTVPWLAPSQPRRHACPVRVESSPMHSHETPHARTFLQHRQLRLPKVIPSSGWAVRFRQR